MDGRQPSRGSVLHDCPTNACKPDRKSGRGQRHSPYVSRHDDRRIDRIAGRRREDQSVSPWPERDRLHTQGRTGCRHLLSERTAWSTRSHPNGVVVARWESRRLSQTRSKRTNAPAKGLQQEFELRTANRERRHSSDRSIGQGAQFVTTGFPNGRASLSAITVTTVATGARKSFTTTRPAMHWRARGHLTAAGSSSALVEFAAFFDGFHSEFLKPRRSHRGRGQGGTRQCRWDRISGTHGRRRQ